MDSITRLVSRAILSLDVQSRNFERFGLIMALRIRSLELSLR